MGGMRFVHTIHTEVCAQVYTPTRIHVHTRMHADACPHILCITQHAYNMHWMSSHFK